MSQNLCLRIVNYLVMPSLGGEEGKFQALMETLIAARISHAIKSVGLATAAFEYALQYSKEREAFGRPTQQISSYKF